MPPDVRPAPELTPRALSSGLLVGALLCVANLYMGLKTGFWDSGHITASVLAFALVSGRSTRLENNAAQTAATAAGAVPAAAGLLGAVPALNLLGRTVPAWGIALWGLALAALGIAFAAALRRRLLEDEDLPFPTGVATAEVIDVLHGGRQAARERTRPLLQGGLAGLLLGWFRDGRPALLPAALPVPGALAGISMATLGIGISTSPLLWGVGMVVGVRVALSMLLGSALAWGAVAPWLVRGPLHVAATRGSIWDWLSWPGTALMVGAALVALVQQAAAFRGALRDLRSAGAAGAGGRLHGLLLGAAAALATLVVGNVVFGLSAPLTALALLLSVVGASVCARAAGLTDLSPLGPVGQATQAVVGGLAPGLPALNVAAGSVVAGGATQTAILLWSMRAGRTLRASPRSQIAAAIAGSALGAAICAPAYALFVHAYGLGSARLPVPTGIQWKAMGEVVAHGLSALPAGALAAVIVAGAAGVIFAALGSTRAGGWVPSAMAMGIGVLVPVDYSLSFVLGALLAHAAPGLRGRGPVIGAGLIAGDSLVGVSVALLTALGLL
ncbi:MAG TPA: OPT/YSL family transporter [Myxococcales bacterium]